MAADGTRAATRRISPQAVVGVGVMCLALLLAVVLAFRFVEGERQRELQAWQLRLGLVADTRTQAVVGWIADNYAALQGLAENASLQLYMTELALADTDGAPKADEPAEAGYLRNLLIATADGAGFVPPPDAGPVDANVERVGVAGIGLVDASARSLVATPRMPPLSERMRNAVDDALDGEPVFIDAFRGSGNHPAVGFALPVFAIQDDGARAIGAVVGVRLVDGALFDRLAQPGDVTRTGESILVRAAGAQIQYVSPLADGAAALSRTLSRETPGLAAAFALEEPGGFGIRRNYAGTEVLLTSRPVAGTPWVLLRTVHRDEALAAPESRLRRTLGVFLGIIVAVAMSFVGIWRHGASLRASRAAEGYRVAAERFENIGKFLRVVTNSQPTHIVAVDGDTRFTFANETAAADAGIAAEEMLGKTLAGVVGPVKAQALSPINRRVMAAFAECDDASVARESHILTFPSGDDEDGPQVIRTSHVPLRGDRDHPPGVLMVLDDITELSRERWRREVLLRRLIDTLVSVVDRRDPFSADHSARVAEVGRCIAEEMVLPPLEVQTVDIAGSLMNLGKIFVPTDLLTKTGPLSDEERALLSRTPQVSADLLRHLPFDGPVVATIDQLEEWWDGSGRGGLAGDAILRPARVLNVANAFVGMVSPRAYRSAMSFDDASNRLMDEAGRRFDRRSVSALINVLDNRGGAERWVHFATPPAATGGAHLDLIDQTA